jgi:hypothetical protein
VAKEAVEAVRRWRLDREERRGRLNELQALLHASRVAFQVQNAQRDRLAARLKARFPEEYRAARGYDRTFSSLYERFDAEDRDLHSLIRVYTEQVMRPLNEAMRSWLEKDVHYRTRQGKSGLDAEFAKQLNLLDAHILLWLAKYQQLRRPIAATALTGPPQP